MVRRNGVYLANGRHTCLTPPRDWEGDGDRSVTLEAGGRVLEFNPLDAECCLETYVVTADGEVPASRLRCAVVGEKPRLEGWAWLRAVYGQGPGLAVVVLIFATMAKGVLWPSETY